MHWAYSLNAARTLAVGAKTLPLPRPWTILGRTAPKQNKTVCGLFAWTFPYLSRRFSRFHACSTDDWMTIGAHQFFIQECGSGGPEHANSTTPSSLDQGNDSTTDTNSVAPTHRPTANVTSPLTPHPTTSTPSSALSTSPSSTSLSSTSSPTARSGAVASTNSHGCTITALAIALLGILSRLWTTTTIH